MVLPKMLDTTQDLDLSDKYLRLKKRSIRKLIILPPKYLGNINRGIDEAILKSNEEIFKEFNGVPVQLVKKVLLQNAATSFDDYPYLQLYVDLECIVFCPKIGSKIKSVVNKVGDTFIGCLICNKINATIFKNSKRATEDGLIETLNNLHVGQNILIKIINIKYEQNDLFLIADYYANLE